MESLFGLFIMAMVGAFFLGVLYLGMEHEKKWEHALRELVDRHKGLRYRDDASGGRKAAVGEVDGVDVVVDSYTTGSGKSKSTWTRWRLTDAAGLPRTASIGEEGVFSFFGKAIAGDDLQIGAAAFDAQVLIRGPELDLRSRLDAGRREVVRQAAREGWVLQDGEWTRRASGKLRSANALDATLQSGLQLCRALRLDTHADDRLAHLVLHDPQPGVRIRTLKAWIAHGRPPVADLERIADGSDGLEGLLAARALGDTDRVRARLDHGRVAVRVQAALTLAELQVVDDAVLVRLTEGLVVEKWTDRCIDQLGHVGTIAAVEPLSAFTQGLMPSVRKRLATDAIRRIQARQVGAEAGQISIIEVEGGGLSVTEVAQAGRLAELKQGDG